MCQNFNFIQLAQLDTFYDKTLMNMLHGDCYGGCHHGGIVGKGLCCEIIVFGL